MRTQMVKTINQGYVPADMELFMNDIVKYYRNVSLFELGRCKCGGKKHPPKK